MFSKLKVAALLALSTLLIGCSDKADPEPNGTDLSSNKEAISVSEEASVIAEPVDERATQAINEKLIGALEGISREQTASEENIGKEALEQLSESDRQALIDMTIESSSRKVSEDADQVLEALKQQAE